MSRTSSLNMVREFHRAFNVPNRAKPRVDKARAKLRLKLLREELKEVAEAAEYAANVGNDFWVARLLQELCDLQYVLDGTFLEFGLARYRYKAFREIHRANMSKLGPDGKPVKREDGKVLKGPLFKPADIVGVLRNGG